jgi:hypothetical protein
MNVNTTKLQTMRDKYEKKYFGPEVVRSHDKAIAEHLVVLSALNCLLRTAKGIQDLNEIETLTRAGNIMIEKYEKIYYG